MLLDPVYIDFWLKVGAVFLAVLFVLFIAVLLVLDLRLRDIGRELKRMNDIDEQVTKFYSELPGDVYEERVE